MSLRLAVMMVIVPILIGLTLRKPRFGLYATTVMYYFRPDVWDEPTWWQPVYWLTIATIVSWAVRAKDLRMPPIMALAMTIVPAMLISTFTAVKSSDVSMETTIAVIKLIIVMFLIVQLIRTLPQLMTFLWVNLIANLWTLKSVVVITLGGGDASRANVSAAQGGGANYLAMTFVMALPLLFYRFIEGSQRERKFAMAVTPFLLFGIMGTGSRGGFLTMFAIFIFLAVRGKKKLAGFAAIVGMTVIFAIVTPQAKWDRFMTTFAGEEDRGFASQSRVELWKAGMKMFWESPIVGVGHDNFQMLSPRYVGYFAGQTPIPYQPHLEGTPGHVGFVAHSTWVQALADGGVVFSMPFFGLFVLAFLILYRVRRLRYDPRTRREIWFASQILEGIMWAFVIASSFGSHMKIDFLWWYFGVVGVLGIIAREQSAIFRHRERQAWLQAQAAAREPEPEPAGAAS
ncbi:MAG: O-antigen ligase family protein [Planctomycetes bacterium]|nr:O-antigen ligase family protein [Planctomycetota bacterium]